MTVLQDLPTEVIELVLSYLDIEPPSTRKFFHEPRPNLFKCPHPPLKNLSRTCHSFRQLTFNSLFLHLKITDHERIDDLLTFLKIHYAGEHQRFHSMLVHDMNCVEGGTAPTLVSTIRKIVDIIKPTDLILALDPNILSMVLVGANYSQDAWAFQIPFQIIRLRCSLLEASNWPGNPRQKTFAILRLYPWTQISFNEGSSVPAYSTYEYFQLRVPSWFERWPLSLLEISDSIGPMFSWIQDPLAHLISSFDFVAVFPFSGCINKLTAILHQLTNLQVLRTQLSPCTWCDEADGEGSAGVASHGTGRAEHRDLWMEFESAYTALADWMDKSASTSHLERLEVLDYNNEGLRSTLDVCFADDCMVRAWTRCAAGVWKKKAEVKLQE